MEILTWSKSTSPAGAKPEIVSEYLLNDLGIFVKREKRMAKKAKFTALTGFRIGYAAIPGTDYRAAPIDRTAIFWHKITAVKEAGTDCLMISGNRNDNIILCFDPSNKDTIMAYLTTMRKQHPMVRAADYVAAAWLCWRDDDDWGDDPAMSLTDMIDLEMDTERFIEPDVLAETILIGVREALVSQESAKIDDTPKFCHNCGKAIPAAGNFCSHCGTPIKPD